MRKVFFLGLSALVAMSTVFACSSTTTTTNPAAPEEGGADGGGTTKEAGKDTSAPVDTDTGTTTDPDQACAAEATLQECAICCGPTNHPTGYKLFLDSLTECACTGTGADGGAPCATDCSATFCKTPPAQATPACNTCLQTSIQNGGCAEYVGGKCNANADCKAQQACVVKCQGKP